MTDGQKYKKYLSFLKTAISNHDSVDKLFATETFSKEVVEFVFVAMEEIQKSTPDKNLVVTAYDVVSIILDKFQKKIEEGSNPFDKKMKSGIDKLLLTQKIELYISKKYQVASTDLRVINLAREHLKRDKSISSPQYIKLHHFYSNINLPDSARYTHMDNGRHHKVKLLIDQYYSSNAPANSIRLSSSTDTEGSSIQMSKKAAEPKKILKRFLTVFAVALAAIAYYVYITYQEDKTMPVVVAPSKAISPQQEEHRVVDVTDASLHHDGVIYDNSFDVSDLSADDNLMLTTSILNAKAEGSSSSSSSSECSAKVLDIFMVDKDITICDKRAD